MSLDAHFHKHFISKGLEVEKVVHNGTMEPVTLMFVPKKQFEKQPANITVRIDPAVADSFKACCDDMRMSYTAVFEGMVRWFAQLPRSSRQLIVGVLDDDEMAAIAQRALIEALDVDHQPGRVYKED